LPNDAAEELIRRAAKAAVEKDEKKAAFKPLLPMEMIIEFMRSDFCDSFASRPGLERIGARTIRKISNDYRDFWF